RKHEFTNPTVPALRAACYDANAVQRSRRGQETHRFRFTKIAGRMDHDFRPGGWLRGFRANVAELQTRLQRRRDDGDRWRPAHYEGYVQNWPHHKSKTTSYHHHERPADS